MPTNVHRCAHINARVCWLAKWRRLGQLAATQFDYGELTESVHKCVHISVHICVAVCMCRKNFRGLCGFSSALRQTVLIYGAVKDWKRLKEKELQAFSQNPPGKLCTPLSGWSRFSCALMPG